VTLEQSKPDAVQRLHKKMIRAFSFRFLENDVLEKIQIAAQPFFIERMQASWNRPVSQKRLKFCLQLKRDAVHE
jgi:hypothetical protein